jgi:hypothetical protein
MVETGQRAKGEEDVKNVVEELEKGNVYEQCLALETVYGSRDVRIAVRFLWSGSK